MKKNDLIMVEKIITDNLINSYGIVNMVEVKKDGSLKFLFDDTVIFENLYEKTFIEDFVKEVKDNKKSFKNEKELNDTLKERLLEVCEYYSNPSIILKERLIEEDTIYSIIETLEGTVEEETIRNWFSKKNINKSKIEVSLNTIKQIKKNLAIYFSDFLKYYVGKYRLILSLEEIYLEDIEMEEKDFQGKTFKEVKKMFMKDILPKMEKYKDFTIETLMVNPYIEEEDWVFTISLVSNKEGTLKELNKLYKKVKEEELFDIEDEELSWVLI